MKRALYIIAIIAFIALLTSCGGKGGPKNEYKISMKVDAAAFFRARFIVDDELDRLVKAVAAMEYGKDSDFFEAMTVTTKDKPADYLGRKLRRGTAVAAAGTSMPDNKEVISAIKTLLNRNIEDYKGYLTYAFADSGNSEFINRFMGPVKDYSYTESKNTLSATITTAKTPKEAQVILASGDGLSFWRTFDRHEVFDPLMAVSALYKMPTEELYAKPHNDGPIDTSNSVMAALLEEEQERKKNIPENDSTPYYVVGKLLAPNIDEYEGYNPVVGFTAARDTGELMHYLLLPASKEMLPPDMAFMWGSQMPTGHYSLYALRVPQGGQPLITDENIADAYVESDDGMPSLVIELDEDGTDNFTAMTSQPGNIAVCLDNRVLVAPGVTAPIDGGKMVITLGGDDPLLEAQKIKVGCINKYLKLVRFKQVNSK